jgi:hypothetical protein
LVRVCQAQLGEDPFSGCVFIFRNRSAKSILILAYDGQGYWLAQKRLSQGRFTWWPESSSAAKRVEAYEAQLLMVAGDMSRVRATYPGREDLIMSSSTTEFHKTWIAQCSATEDIRDQFGLSNALDYLIGEKLFSFLRVAEQDTLFAAEVPDFITEIRRLLTAEVIRDYLDRLEKTKYLAPLDPDLEMDDLDELDNPDEDEPLLENPVMGAEELLRFFRVRQLLQA